MRRNTEPRGFTLIETMVTMLIVSVALLALGGLLIQSIRTNQQSAERISASVVSNAILSDYRARILAGSAPPSGSPVTGVRDGFSYTLTATKSGEQWVLHVSLVPSVGGRLNKFENQTMVSATRMLE